MPRALKILIATSLATVLIVLAPQALRLWERTPDKPAVAYLANSGQLHAAYTRWAAEHEAAGGDRSVVLALRWSKGLSVEFSRASGLATLDLISGTVSVEIRGLSKTAGWDVWLVGGCPNGRCITPGWRPAPARINATRSSVRRSPRCTSRGETSWSDLPPALMISCRG